MKLLFWPLLLFSLVQWLFFRDQENYWCVKLTEIVLGLVLIPVLFYTYNGVFGKSPDWINIAIFYITALLVFFFEWWAFKKDWLQCKHPWLAFATICLIGVLFVVFTFAPPQIPLFQDPLSQNYPAAFACYHAALAGFNMESLENWIAYIKKQTKPFDKFQFL